MDKITNYMTVYSWYWKKNLNRIRNRYLHKFKQFEDRIILTFNHFNKDTYNFIDLKIPYVYLNSYYWDVVILLNNCYRLLFNVNIPFSKKFIFNIIQCYKLKPQQYVSSGTEVATPINGARARNLNLRIIRSANITFKIYYDFVH